MNGCPAVACWVTCNVACGQSRRPSCPGAAGAEDTEHPCALSGTCGDSRRVPSEASAHSGPRPGQTPVVPAHCGHAFPGQEGEAGGHGCPHPPAAPGASGAHGIAPCPAAGRRAAGASGHVGAPRAGTPRHPAPARPSHSPGSRPGEGPAAPGGAGAAHALRSAHLPGALACSGLGGGGRRAGAAAGGPRAPFCRVGKAGPGPAHLRALHTAPGRLTSGRRTPALPPTPGSASAGAGPAGDREPLSHMVRWSADRRSLKNLCPQRMGGPSHGRPLVARCKGHTWAPG